MKYLLTLLWALALTFAQGEAAPVSDNLYKAVAEACASIDAAERAALASQSLEDLNAAAREQVIRELKLSGNKRREFESLYDTYRKALDNAITPSFDMITPGEVNLRQNLKTKLANIAATAQVKRDYVDKFATILSAEQIRTLYNAEGAISTSIKREAASRTARLSRLVGSGRMVTQDWGLSGNYTELVAGTYCHITISQAVRTISVTSNDNVIDYISMKNENGTLEFDFNAVANNIENIHIDITVPMSNNLRTLTAGTYGRVSALSPLKVASFKVDISSYGAVNAEIESSENVQVRASSYGKFKGQVRCESGDFRISSYGKFEGPVDCRDSCKMVLSSYAGFSDGIKASGLLLAVGSYARFSGSVSVAKTARIEVSSYGSFSGEFAGRELWTSIGNYAKMAVKGTGQVDAVTVGISSGASFSAPGLRVVNYNLKASGYSRADVWCSGVLKVDASSQSKVTYEGPCTVQAQVGNISRR